MNEICRSFLHSVLNLFGSNYMWSRLVLVANIDSLREWAFVVQIVLTSTVMTILMLTKPPQTSCCICTARLFTMNGRFQNYIYYKLSVSLDETKFRSKRVKEMRE
ncbi:hypothetical protein MtrunA17_Chr6g0457231 [Medicago truncatula]|uniref:Uncharacterized protein n=1 Tax=Medicago truncatula TaxID=3880 RepID=A0A396HAS2_MEDTR|nr:hypothetical protein MtrunA17_Chr6g0457231 [Medicago truncatula]